MRTPNYQKEYAAKREEDLKSKRTEAEKILAMRKSLRMTLGEIGLEYGLTKEAIRRRIIKSKALLRQPPPTKALSPDTPLSECGLSVRAINALETYSEFCAEHPDWCNGATGIFSLSDLCNTTEQDLLKMRNIGVETVAEIKCVMAQASLSLKYNPRAKHE